MVSAKTLLLSGIVLAGCAGAPVDKAAEAGTQSAVRALGAFVAAAAIAVANILRR